MGSPGRRDNRGGFTVAAPQWWWGHRAEKWSWFYIVGVEPGAIPEIPFRIGRAPRVITNSRDIFAGDPRFRSEVTKRERDATPPALADWLVQVARLSLVIPGNSLVTPGEEFTVSGRM